MKNSCRCETEGVKYWCNDLYTDDGTEKMHIINETYNYVQTREHSTDKCLEVLTTAANNNVKTLLGRSCSLDI